MKKKLSEIIDELSITNCKLFFLIEKVQKNEHSREDATKIQKLNKYRSELVNAINEFFDERENIKV